MAPPKRLRTYSRGNNSSISCVEAMDILFAKNLAVKKLHGKVRKGKSKIQIKELPKKITSMLCDESSLHVNVNDTFDKILKAPQKNIEPAKDMSVKIIANKTSTSVIKHYRKNHNFSPMLAKLRSHQSQSLTSNNTNSISWFKHTTIPGERITNELEIEKGQVNKPSRKGSSLKQNSARESPPLLRSRVKHPEIVVTDASGIIKDNPEKSQSCNSNKNIDSFIDPNLSFNPIFTNSIREKILMHSSTPLVSNKATRLVKHPISPIKIVDDEINKSINESLKEIKSWEVTNRGFIEPEEKLSNSLLGIEDFQGFDRQNLVDQSPLHVNKDKFVTLRGRSRKSERKSVNSESEKNKNSSEKPKAFNLDDFELFYNKFKTRSFKLEDFEQFHKSLMKTNSLNQGETGELTNKLSQIQVNKLNSISLKDFESFYEAYQSKIEKISMLQGPFLDKSNRSVNYVTNRRNRSLGTKPVNLSKKYVKLNKQFDLKNLVVVLDNILINNSKVKLKRGRSLYQSAMMNSFSKTQPIVHLKRLSGSALKRYPKAKEQVSLNRFKACRKFSSNWTPSRITRSISLDRSGDNESSNFNDLIPPDIFSLGQLFINMTRMPLEIDNLSSKITEIKDDSVIDKKVRKSLNKDIRISKSPAKGKQRALTNDSISEKENESKNRSSLNTSNTHRKSFNSNPKKNRKSKVVEPDELCSDDDETSIHLFLHSESFKEASNKKSNGEKQYIAKILDESVSDTELEVTDLNKNLFLKEVNSALFKYSQESAHTFNTPTKTSKSSRVLRSYSNISLNSFQDIVENNGKSSSKDQRKRIMLRSCRANKSESNIYLAQDLSQSILVNKTEDDNVSSVTPKIRDVVVNLTLQTWNKYHEVSPQTSQNVRVTRGSTKSSISSDNERENRNSNQTRKNSIDLNSSPLIFDDSYIEKSLKQEKTPIQPKNPVKKSLRFNLQSSATPIKRSLSDVDIINSSVNTPNSDYFKMPMVVTKWKEKVDLKAGKSWRRSLLLHKRESFIDLTQDLEKDNSNSRISTRQSSLMPQNMSVKRNSIRIVPLCDPRLSRRRTVLQTYAQTNLSTVLDESANESTDVTAIKPKLSLRNSLPSVTAKDIVLKRCMQTEPLPFEKLYPKSLLKDCKKIGEGVYGEVFLYSNPTGDTTVMKVIPIEGDKIINGERQKKFEEILSEIVIALELSKLRKNTTNQTSAFTEVQRVCCVKGKYPNKLLDLWHAYDSLKGSENDPPGVFEEDQLYIVLDLANGGRDLEAYEFNNALQAVSMFKQVTCALAIAEQHLEFEHRDLHWGNVLLKSVDKSKKLTYKHKGKVIECQTQGVEVAIIDFTLSRIAHDGVVIFNDLGQDPDLFVAEGDYQFDIYRLMKEKNCNNWQIFEPYTNILWLHYILKKSITALRYKNIKTKIHKKNIECLKEYERVILDFKSVSEFVSEYY